MLDLLRPTTMLTLFYQNWDTPTPIPYINTNKFRDVDSAAVFMQSNLSHPFAIAGPSFAPAHTENTHTTPPENSNYNTAAATNSPTGIHHATISKSSEKLTRVPFPKEDWNSCRSGPSFWKVRQGMHRKRDPREWARESVKVALPKQDTKKQ